jgi:peptidoglycan hydrolase CwlO-like protein
MRATQSLWHAGRLIIFSGALLCAMLVCVAFLSAASLRKSAEPRNASAPFAAGQADCDQLRKTVQQLTADVDQLKRKVADLGKYRQIDYLRDLLMKEEQRAEALQAQIQDVIDKDAPLQTRIDQLDEQLRPDNIDQALAGVGSMRPEEAKDALRRRLGNEKRRIQAQLDLLHQSQARLQASVATADASIQRLRLRLVEATRS